jgi:hypothetical protein
MWLSLEGKGKAKYDYKLLCVKILIWESPLIIEKLFLRISGSLKREWQKRSGHLFDTKIYLKNILLINCYFYL